MSDYRDIQPVWLHFWELECSFCQSELPDVEKAYQAYKAQGIVLVGIAIADSPKEVGQLVQKHGYSGFYALDGDRSVSDQYCINAVPTHLFIDRHGVIQSILVGRAGPSQLKAALDALLRH